MELQFNPTKLDCLQTLKRQVLSQELTQEFRIPDGLPDIGRVLGCWSEIVLRGKDWRSGNAGASGGAKVWALYEPENGEDLCCVESWIPFQMKWEIPDTRHDGAILVHPFLRGADARSLSARKLLLRVDMGMLSETVIPSEIEVYNAGETPEDVQLLRKTYPMMIPKETGERSFAIEEELRIPASNPQPKKLIHYALRPELIDRKVMADKVVFRGVALGHVLYLAEDNQIHSWEFELPFSQYSQLDKDYDESANVRVIPVVTELELNCGENGCLNLKANITGQYVVNEIVSVVMVEDAYSPVRSMELNRQQLQLPVILSSVQETVHTELTVPIAANAVADTTFYFDYPQLNRKDDASEAELTGNVQLLYYDENRILQNSTAEWNTTWKLMADSETDVEIGLYVSGMPQTSLNSEAVNVSGDLLLEAIVKCQYGMEMVTALKLGEQLPPDPNRPSLVLRRAGDAGLWKLAKETGSTVERILQANGLTQEPDREKMLLIPVQ